jgi:hypothetical protein
MIQNANCCRAEVIAGVDMKDLFQVLRKKELDIARPQGD